MATCLIEIGFEFHRSQYYNVESLNNLDSIVLMKLVGEQGGMLQRKFQQMSANKIGTIYDLAGLRST